MAERRNEQLVAQLREAKNRLMIAETQIERLSAILDSRSDTAVTRYAKSAPMQVAQPPQAAAPPALPRELPVTNPPPPLPIASSVSAGGDIPLATVVTERANLRTGPGRDSSILMEVPHGAKLAVETRQGNWYQVISPTGVRAWVAASTVSFGKQPRPAAVRSAEEDPEEKALQLIKQRGR
jgi:uncharacterized protein YgiM (DUF1202 family)